MKETSASPLRQENNSAHFSMNIAFSTIKELSGGTGIGKKISMMNKLIGLTEAVHGVTWYRSGKKGHFVVVLLQEVKE